MNGVAATLLAIGLCAAYGTTDRVYHDSARRNPVDRKIADETSLRRPRQNWWQNAFRRR